MLENLLEWRIRSKRIRELGNYAEEVMSEATDLRNSCAIEDDSDNYPENESANRLARSIDQTLKVYRAVRPGSRFDNLVYQDLVHSLRITANTLRFFFTPDSFRRARDGTRRSIIDYLSIVFMPKDDEEFGSNGNSTHARRRAGAIRLLEQAAKDIDQDAMRTRRHLLRDFMRYPADIDWNLQESILSSQLPVLLDVANRFSVDHGYVSQDQADKAVERWRAAKALSYDIAQKNLRGEFAPLFGDRTPEEFRQIPFFADGTYGYYSRIIGGDLSYFDWINRLLELRESLVLFTRDRKSGTIRPYFGDLHRVNGHENFHNLQAWLSRGMPVGVRNRDYSSPNRDVITEGVPTHLEQWYVEWLAGREGVPNMPENHLEAMLVGNPAREANHLIRLLNTIYIEEYFYEDKVRDGRKKLWRLTGNQAMLDDMRFPKDHFPGTMYFASYEVGARYVQRTLQKLHEHETHRLGNADLANAFIRANRDVVMQGLLTGNFGWSTHGTFFLEHYWPRALKLMDEKQSSEELTTRIA